MWHAVSRDRVPLRKQYLEAILPPFVSILRRWRPYLAGIHELVATDGLNPLAVDDPALAADALPIEVKFTKLADYKVLFLILGFSNFMASLNNFHISNM